MRILVTGGAGYIGSHMVKRCLDAATTSWVFDNLSSGHREAVPAEPADRRRPRGQCRRWTSASRRTASRRSSTSRRSRTSASRSREPAKYYRTTSSTPLDAARACRRARASDGSSSPAPAASTARPSGADHRGRSRSGRSTRTATPSSPSSGRWATTPAAYGARATAPCATSTPPAPAATATHRRGPRPRDAPDPAGDRGRARPAAALEVFGTDYPTPDGTCVRDYIHVVDLAEPTSPPSSSSSAAAPVPHSTSAPATAARCARIIERRAKVTGRPSPHVDAPRRAGDPPPSSPRSTAPRRSSAGGPRSRSLAHHP